jgi:hypothetical protein
MREYKLDSLQLAQPFQSTNSEIKTEKLLKVVTSYAENIDRVANLAVMPAGLFLWGSAHGIHHAITYRQLIGTDFEFGAEIPDDKSPEFDSRVQTGLANSLKRIAHDKAMTYWVHAESNRGVQALQRHIEKPLTSAMDALFAAVLIGTWSSFEVLMEDLWVAALNACPNPLAGLYGAPNRIAAMAEGQRKGVKLDVNKKRSTDQDKKIDIGTLFEFLGNGKQIGDCLGDILKSRYDFSSLNGARDAYSATFWIESDELDKVLSNPNIDALSRVRNVLVHSQGIADTDYVTGIVGTSAPSLLVGEKLELDGSAVASLANPVVTLAGDLINAVDTWICEQRDGKHPPRKS